MTKLLKANYTDDNNNIFKVSPLKGPHIWGKLHHDGFLNNMLFFYC